MGTRAYLMITVQDEVVGENFVQVLRELEDLVDVDFVDPVEGDCDIVVMIDAPVSVPAVAEKIAALPWVKSLATLKIVSIFERHHSSKKSLLEAMKQEGVRA